uniref:E3 ubiquitin-protein ligase PPP1R11 n=1 Tax=Parastrongyloides trichosuri TaxID=131310 RepID=A0A0N4ZP42_PARTI
MSTVNNIPSPSTTTITETIIAEATSPSTEQEGETLILRLSSTDNTPRVHWSENTVDNEHMNKKKSKCCCIFKKQRRWDEDSSGSDEEKETEHCRGHVEKSHGSKQHCDGFCTQG